MMDLKCTTTEFGTIMQCSKKGPNHEVTAIDNQDSIGIGYRKGKGISIAVADGVSSCKNSKTGSEYAVQVIEELMDAIINDELNVEDTDEIKKFIVRKWKTKIELEWNNYASTVNFAIIVDDTVLLGKIGDGSIYAEINDEKVLMIDEDDFYTSETFALGEMVRKSTIVLQRTKLETKKLKIVMMTDGIAKEIESGSEIDLLEYISDLTQKEISEIRIELSAWLDVLDKKNGDDKSLAVITMEECIDE